MKPSTMETVRSVNLSNKDTKALRVNKVKPCDFRENVIGLPFQIDYSSSISGVVVFCVGVCVGVDVGVGGVLVLMLVLPSQDVLVRFLPWMAGAFFENVPSESFWRRLAIFGVAILGCFGAFSSLDGKGVF